MAPANTRDVVLACRALGLRLRVTKDDDLRCEPGERLTPELRQAIRANREDLLYDVLLSDALRYVAVERHVEGADPGAVLDAHQEAIDAAYRRRDRPAYRAAIREFVRAGLAEIERARGLDLPTASPISPRLMKEGALSHDPEEPPKTASTMTRSGYDGSEYHVIEADILTPLWMSDSATFTDDGGQSGQGPARLDALS